MARSWADMLETIENAWRADQAKMIEAE